MICFELYSNVMLNRDFPTFELMKLTTKNGFLSILILCSTALISCESKEEAPVAKHKALEIDKTKVEFQLTGNLDEASSFDIKLEFPQLNNVDSSLLKTIIQQETHKLIHKSTISNSLLENKEQVVAELEIAYKAFRADFPEINSEWYLNRTVEVVYQSEKYVTLMVHEQSYMGGGHSNELMTFKTFIVKTGQKISLSQLLSNNEYLIAEGLAENAFRKQKGFKPSDDLKANGWYFPNGRFTLNNNYHLTDSTIIIRYNTYDIGSYEAGATTLELDLDKIKKGAA
ncbi:MAG: hypothetical protein ACJASM_000787 [Salibacteraceae bacterium]|jgi:hypothetical protein